MNTNLGGSINLLSSMIIDNRASESDDIIYIQLPGEVSFLPSVFTKTKKTDGNIQYMEWNSVSNIPGKNIKLTYYWRLTSTDKLNSENIITLYDNNTIITRTNVNIKTQYEQIDFLNLFDVISNAVDWTDESGYILTDSIPKFIRGTISNVLSELQDNADSLNTLDYNSISSLTLSTKNNYYVYTINNDGYLYLTPKITSNINDTKNLNCIVLGFNDLNGIYNNYYNKHIYDVKDDITLFAGSLRSPVLTISNNSQYDSPTNIYIDGKNNPIHILGYIDDAVSVNNLSLEFVPIHSETTGISVTSIKNILASEIDILDVELFPAYNTKFNSEYTGLSLTIENFYQKQFISDKFENYKNITNIYNTIFSGNLHNTYTLKTVKRISQEDQEDYNSLNYIYTANELAPVWVADNGLMNFTTVNTPQTYLVSVDNKLLSSVDYKVFDRLIFNINYTVDKDNGNSDVYGNLIYEYNMCDGLVPEYDELGNLIAYSPVYVEDNNIKIASNTVSKVSLLTISDIVNNICDSSDIENIIIPDNLYIRLDDKSVGEINYITPEFEYIFGEDEPQLTNYTITYTKYQYNEPNNYLSEDANDLNKTFIILSQDNLIVCADNMLVTSVNEPANNISSLNYELNISSANSIFNLFVTLPIEIKSETVGDEKIIYYTLSSVNNLIWNIYALGESDKYSDGYKTYEFNNIFDSIDSDFIENLANNKLDWTSFISAILEHFYTNISDKLINSEEEQENKLLIKSPGRIYSNNNSLTVEKDSDYKFEIYIYDSNTNPHPIETANQVPMSFESIELNDKEKLYVFGYRYTFISVSENILIPHEYVSITNNKFNWITPNIFANIINFNGSNSCAISPNK